VQPENVPQIVRQEDRVSIGPGKTFRITTAVAFGLPPRKKLILAYYNCISSVGNTERQRGKLWLHLPGRTEVKIKHPVNTADLRVESELRKELCSEKIRNPYFVPGTIGTKARGML
jgi:hypothetical protein